MYSLSVHLLLVPEIHKNVDKFLGIKNIFELEGIINSSESYFSFLIGKYHFFQRNELYWNQGNKSLLK